MANLTETINYDTGVYQIATTDPVSGGAGGIANMPTQNLANRTAWLKSQVDNLNAGNTIPPTVAPLNSPHFTGDPQAPTPAMGDNDLSVPNTSWVQQTVHGLVNISLAGLSTLSLTVAQAGYGIIELTGALTANCNVVMPGAGDWVIWNNTTGAFTVTVKMASGTGINVAQGLIRNLWSDGNNIYTANSDYTGIAIGAGSTAVTQAAGNSSALLATTAYVMGQVATTTPNMAGVGAVGTSTFFARADHVHPTDTSRAPLASPNFTGTPQIAGVNIATQTWVAASYAPLANPTFSGTVSITTAAQFDSTVKAASTAWVQRALGSLSGFMGINTNTTLTAANAGSAIQFNGGSTITASLPVANNTPAGTCFWFFNGSSYAQTVGVSGASDFIYPGAAIGGGATNKTVNLQPGQDLVVMSRGASNEYDIIGGSAMLQYASQLNVGGNLLNNGNQVWHAGNFNPANYAALTGATFTGGLQSTNLNVYYNGNVSINIGRTGADASINVAGSAGSYATDSAAGDVIVRSTSQALRLLSGSGVSAIAITGSAITLGYLPTYSGSSLATQSWVSGAYAPLASPALSGSPTAPTPAVGNNSTAIATTAYFMGQASATTPAMNGAAAVGTGTTWARADHVHPTDTTLAPLAGTPNFTGNPQKSGVNLATVNDTVANATTWAGSHQTISTAAPSGGVNGDIWFQYS